MTTIDDKVVAMSFESDKFEKGVSTTLSALDKLKQALHFPNAGKGLDDVNEAGRRLDLSHIGRTVDDIKGRLGAMRATALLVFADIASNAVRAGARFAKAFTLGPLIAGFQEYSTNLNSVQTILANTEASGATLKDVNGALLELNKYSDKTIYNFSQMARNIGTFTAAGVDLKTSTASIKGIANLAALSGSNAEQASTAMYQLSQAISAGRVGLQDWNSVVNAGMGGTVFQRALAQTAEAMGTIKKGAVTLEGPMKNVSINGESFRQSMQAGPGKQSWLTSKVLTATLQQFTGDLSDAELKAKGFNDAQIKAIQQTAKTATHAATEVKTISQVLDVAKETAGSGWAQTWQLVFGDFGQAKKTFTDLSNAVNGFINANSNARNKVLGEWKKLGGRTILIDGIKDAFHNLGLILEPIKDAFRDIFPATTGRDLLTLTKRFHDFAEALKPSDDTVHNLRRTFRGLFALLDIGKQIVEGIFTVFGRLFGVIHTGNGGFLNFTGNVGDMIVALDKALKKGDAFHHFFERLGDILAVPVKALQTAAGVIAGLFDGFSPGGVSGQMSALSGAMGPLAKVMNAVADAWGKLMESFQGGSGIDWSKVLTAIGTFVAQIPVAIGHALSNVNFDAILSVIRTGLLGAIVVMLKGFLGKGSLLEQLSKGGGGILGNIGESFGALTGSLKAMQTNIKADTMQKIAIAIGILAASILALSFVDPERLKSSMTAITVGFGQLLAAMAILDKISSNTGFIKLPFIAGSMILMATAIDILAIAVFAFSRLNWEQLGKGLAGVGASLILVTGAMQPMSASAPGMVRASVGIIAIAAALKLMASAVKDFAAMNVKQLAKGLIAVSIGLDSIVIAMQRLPAKGAMVRAGLGVVAIAAALKILASAVNDFGQMNIRVLAKGLVAISIGLDAMVVAMQRLPPNMAVQAAGLVLVSVALQGIAKAVEKMGGMSMKQIAKGILAMALSLDVLAAAMYAMKGSIGGSVALAAAAASISLMAPALLILGKMSWKQIVTGLGALAGALLVLGVAGSAITAAVPALLALGAAVALVGVGLAGAGAGIFLISSGLSALAVAGPAGVGILLAALKELSKAIPDMAKNLVLGLLEIVKGISDTAPEFVKAIVKILGMVLDAIIKVMPKVEKAFDAIVQAAVDILHKDGPKVIKAGLELLLNLLKGIRDNIGKVVTMVADIVINLIDALAKKAGDIIRAGANLLVSLLKGIGDNLFRVVTAGGSIIVKFLEGIGNNLKNLVTAGLDIVTKLLKAISDNLGKVITGGADVVAALIKGIGTAYEKIATAAVNAAIHFVNTMVKQILKMTDKGAQAVVDFLNGVAKIIDKREPEIIAAFANIGEAIVVGMIKGMDQAFPALKAKALSMVKHLPKTFLKHLGINSPSKVFMDIGSSIIEGLALGLDRHQDATKSMTDMGNSLIKTIENLFGIKSPSTVMRDIGLYVTQGFAQGIRSGTDEAKSAFAELRGQLKDAVEQLKSDFDTENAKLIELQTNKKQTKENADAIAKQTKVVYGIIDALGEARKAQELFNKGLKDNKIELLKLSEEYERVGARLDKAKEALATAQQTRKDAIKTFSDQYSTLPDIVTQDAEGNAINQLATYMGALKNQANAVSAYRATLDQLRKLGLDDATYQKLLQEGTADQQFASQLLSGGRTAVQALNTLDRQLMTVSKTLATNAANNLYQAGVDAAQGLVNGLKDKRDAIRKEMELIARVMITSLRKELNSKSPSKEFADIGKDSMLGLAQGVVNSSKVVTDAVQSAGSAALTAMRATVRSMSGAISDELSDASPVITPVLDLTAVQKQASALAGTTAASFIPFGSLGQASIISARTAQAQADPTTSTTPATEIKFEQNNYSPEALTEVEIYRQTKNGLSRLRDALAT